MAPRTPLATVQSAQRRGSYANSDVHRGANADPAASKPLEIGIPHARAAACTVRHRGKCLPRAWPARWHCRNGSTRPNEPTTASRARGPRNENGEQRPPFHARTCRFRLATSQDENGNHRQRHERAYGYHPGNQVGRPFFVAQKPMYELSHGTRVRKAGQHQLGEKPKCTKGRVLRR